MATAEIINLAVIASYVATFLFAAGLGRTPERLGAAILAIGLIATWTAQAAGGFDNYFATGVIDLSVSAAFGALALRYPDRLWPGIAGSCQFLVFAFSATRAINYPLSEFAYLAALNLSGLAVLAAIATGTYAARFSKPRRSEWDEAAAFLSRPYPA